MSIMGLVLFPLWLLAMIWAYMRPAVFTVASLGEVSVGKSSTGDAGNDDEAAYTPKDTANTKQKANDAPEKKTALKGQ